MMVAAISGEGSTRLDESGGGCGNPRTRTPLLGSEKSAVGRESGNGQQRRLRSRSVSSRYFSSSPAISTTTSATSNSSTSNSTTLTTSTAASSSSSSSKRYVSPLVYRSSNDGSTELKNRSQSAADRRRVTVAVAPPDVKLRNAGEGLSGGSVASKLSSRSLSVSFQGQAFSLPISKTKVVPNVRKVTPERRRGTPLRGGDQVENSRPGESHRWPARTRPVALSRSIDYSNADNRFNGSNAFVKDLDCKEDWFHSRMSTEFGDARVRGTDTANKATMPSDLTTSDTDSVSSGSTSGLQESNGLSGQLKGGPCGAFVSAKFLQETNSRIRRMQDPSSPLSISPSARILGPSKCFQSKRFSTDGPIISPRTTPSPTRGAPRSASPSKFMMSSGSYVSRGNSSSPSRADGGYSSGSNNNNGPSILSFSADIRRGKMPDSLVFNAHLLRLLYNRHLQWRFINAQADATFLKQSRTAELPYLEEWFLQDAEHLSSVLGITEALKASILRLPITGKAVADIQNIKDAVRSAVDVMQAMMSSLFSLPPKIEEMNSLVAELKNATAKERSLLTQCKGLVSIATALQVRECSMRTHILQLNRDITTSSSMTPHL